LILASTGIAVAGQGRIDRKEIAARQLAASDQPGASARAFKTLAQKLAAAGYTPIPAHPRDLIGGLPAIVAFIQGKLDAKDVQLTNKKNAIAAKDAEIAIHAAASQFRAAFVDQVARNALDLKHKTLLKQRAQIQEGYNEIQSWAIAFIVRRISGR
jgi:hypothetical protein